MHDLTPAGTEPHDLEQRAPVRDALQPHAPAKRTDPLAHVTPNVVMNAYVLEAAYRAGVRKFLFISSGAALLTRSAAPAGVPVQPVRPMSGILLAENVIDRLRRRYPSYHETAYLFILSALHFSIDRLGEPRHVTGRELAEGCRDLALQRWGLLARSVLEYWGITCTRDLGEIVFALVELGVLAGSHRTREAWTAFGAGDAMIGSILVVNLDRQPRRWRGSQVPVQTPGRIV